MDNKALDLLEIRDQIDGIDKEIVELFEKRMQLSAEVAEYKISNNKAVLDPQREKEKLNTLEKYASNSFNRVGVYELFRQMMAMSRKLQYRILAEKGKAEKSPFRKVSSLPIGSWIGIALLLSLSLIIWMTFSKLAPLMSILLT